MEIDLEELESALQSAVRQAMSTVIARFREPPAEAPLRLRTRRDEILEWIRRNPRRQAIEISRGVFGARASQPHVHGYLMKLEADGQIAREGRPARWSISAGGPGSNLNASGPRRLLVAVERGGS